MYAEGVKPGALPSPHDMVVAAALRRTKQEEGFRKKKDQIKPKSDARSVLQTDPSKWCRCLAP